MSSPEAVRELLDRAAEAGLGDHPAVVPVQDLVAAGQARIRRRRWQAVGGVALAAVVAAGISAGVAERYWLADHHVPGFGEFRSVNCGGVRVALSALPGRQVSPTEHGGPAEGLDQVYRLYEWSRRTPYDNATWTLVQPRDGQAMLVATGPGVRTYVPVRRQVDGHWLAFQPCRSG